MNEYQPDYCSHPGETLEEVLDERGISVVVLDSYIHIGSNRIYQILDGQASIANIAALLEPILGVPAVFWLRRQEQYDQCIARIKEAEDL